MNRFHRFELRTTEVTAARDFYGAVAGDGAVAAVVAMPEAAAARGAPAHWLGQIAVDDVERAARTLAERGATRLGPTRAAPGGGETAVLRDPGGAIFAVEDAPRPRSGGPEVVWHELDVADPLRAARLYAEVFGWRMTGRLELGGLRGHQLFAWTAGGPDVGSISDVTELPGVHPQWVFHFAVPALEPALEQVRRRGGVVMLPATPLPAGGRFALCDDPHGAGFGLRECSGPGASAGPRL